MNHEAIHIIGRFIVNENEKISFVPASLAMLKLMRPSQIEGETLARVVGNDVLSHREDRLRIAKAFGIDVKEVSIGDIAAFYELAMDVDRQNLSVEHPDLRNWLARTAGYQVVKNPDTYK